MPLVEFVAFWFDELIKVLEWRRLSPPEKTKVALIWFGTLATIGIALWLPSLWAA